MSGIVYWSYPILPFLILACTFFSDNLSRHSCIYITLTCECSLITWILLSSSVLTWSFFQWSTIAKKKNCFLLFTLRIRTGIYFCYLNSTVPQNLNTNCKRVSQVKTQCANYSTLVNDLLEKKTKLKVKPIYRKLKIALLIF